MTEAIKYLSHRTGRNQAGADLKALLLLSKFYIAGSCYAMPTTGAGGEK